jgi:hypothetical protein
MTSHKYFKLNLPPGCQLVNYTDYSEIRFPVASAPALSAWFADTKSRLDCEMANHVALENAEPCTTCEKGIVKGLGGPQLCPDCFGSCRKGFRPMGFQAAVADPAWDGKQPATAPLTVQTVQIKTDLPVNENLNDLLRAAKLDSAPLDCFLPYEPPSFKKETKLNIHRLADLLARSITARLDGQSTEDIYEEITTP